MRDLTWIILILLWVFVQVGYTIGEHVSHSICWCFRPNDREVKHSPGLIVPVLLTTLRGLLHKKQYSLIQKSHLPMWKCPPDKQMSFKQELFTPACSWWSFFASVIRRELVQQQRKNAWVYVICLYVRGITLGEIMWTGHWSGQKMH